MWWSGYGWWWWWWGILIIFFLLPLGYGWGMRGWGPWYRRRRVRRDVRPPEGTPTDPLATGSPDGWGWLGTFLWIVLIALIIWLIAVWGWGGTGYATRT